MRKLNKLMRLDPSLKRNDSQSKDKVVLKPSKSPCSHKERLLEAEFRYVNEQLYTRSGEEAMQLFSENPQMFANVTRIDFQLDFV
jgi:hypothetical protein